jgi:ribosomal 50S subunit-recycling heat shock protein
MMTRIDLMFFFAQLYKKRSFTVVHIEGRRTTVKIMETDNIH